MRVTFEMCEPAVLRALVYDQLITAVRVCLMCVRMWAVFQADFFFFEVLTPSVCISVCEECVKKKVELVSRIFFQVPSHVVHVL